MVLVAVVVASAVGCVTTRETKPDGTVIERTELQAEQVQAIGDIAGKIYDYYSEMKVAEAQQDQAKAAEKREMALQLVELLKTYKGLEQDVVVPVPRELLDAEGK